MKNVDFGVQVGIGALGRAVGAIVAFLGSVYIARYVGDTVYGTFYFLMAIVAVLDNPITGWAAACRKRFTEVDFDDAAAVGGMYLPLIVVIVPALIFSIVRQFYTITLFSRVREFLGTEPFHLWILLVSVISLTISLNLIQATEHFGISTWVQASRDIIRVIAQIVLVTFISDLFGLVVGIFFANVIMIGVALRIVGIVPRIPSWDEIQYIWEFARAAIPDGIVGTAMFRMDILLLGGLAASLFVGNYRVGMNLTMPALFISGVMSNGLMAKVSNNISRNEDPTPQIQRALWFASLIAIPIALGALVMGVPLAVTVYSSQYREAGLFIGALGIYRLLQSQLQQLTAVLSGYDRPDLNFRLNFIGLILNVLLGVVLFYTIGPAGIAIATVISASVRVVFAGWWAKRFVDIRLLSRPVQEQLVGGAVMTLVIILIRTLFGFESWIGVVGTVGLGGCIYLGFLLVISEHLRGTLRTVLADAGIHFGNLRPP